MEIIYIEQSSLPRLRRGPSSVVLQCTVQTLSLSSLTKFSLAEKPGAIIPFTPTTLVQRQGQLLCHHKLSFILLGENGTGLCELN